MGCVTSSASRPFSFSGESAEGQQQRFRRPRWATPAGQELTLEELETLRATFWETQPAYGGQQEIWDALKAAAGAEDMATARLIIETAGIIVAGNDHRGSTFYDERGAKYELPPYTLANPINMKPG